MTVTDDVVAVNGPGVPAFVAPFCAKTGITVPLPALQALTVSVYVVPEPVTANEQPVRVPELVKSLLSTPVTETEKSTVNV